LKTSLLSTQIDAFGQQAPAVDIFLMPNPARHIGVEQALHVGEIVDQRIRGAKFVEDDVPLTADQGNILKHETLKLAFVREEEALQRLGAHMTFEDRQMSKVREMNRRPFQSL
jgi:hypothetical protein